MTFLDRYGNEIGKRGVLHSDAVPPLSEIPDHMIKSALATEDRRFYQHFGIDLIGTLRALISNIRSESVQGGSSITQQLAKNLFLTSERTLDRKIKEAFLAIWLETNLSKDEILKMYFDRAYMGGGTFGVEAAAQYYFDKSIRDVTLAEAALLGGLFKAPTTYAPHNNPGKSKIRTNEVLTNLVQAGFMTEGQVHGARLKPAEVKERPERYTPDYFLDWAFGEVKRVMKGKNNFVLKVKQRWMSTCNERAKKSSRTSYANLADQNALALALWSLLTSTVPSALLSVEPIMVAVSSTAPPSHGVNLDHQSSLTSI